MAGGVRRSRGAPQGARVSQGATGKISCAFRRAEFDTRARSAERSRRAGYIVDTGATITTIPHSAALALAFASRRRRVASKCSTASGVARARHHARQYLARRLEVERARSRPMPEQPGLGPRPQLLESFASASTANAGADARAEVMGRGFGWGPARAKPRNCHECVAVSAATSRSSVIMDPRSARVCVRQSLVDGQLGPTPGANLP